jgi:hypothetical protein
LPSLESISWRKFNQPSEFLASPLVCDSCFGTIKLPKVQIGT